MINLSTITVYSQNVSAFCCILNILEILKSFWTYRIYRKNQKNSIFFLRGKIFLEHTFTIKKVLYALELDLRSYSVFFIIFTKSVRSNFCSALFTPQNTFAAIYFVLFETCTK